MQPWQYADSWNKNIVMEDLVMILDCFNSTGISGVNFDLHQHERTLAEAWWEGGLSYEFYIASDVIRKMLFFIHFAELPNSSWLP